MKQHLRNITAAIVGLALRPVSFRFSKDYRHGSTRWHRAVYAVCNTVTANHVAWGESAVRVILASEQFRRVEREAA